MRFIPCLKAAGLALAVLTGVCAPAAAAPVKALHMELELIAQGQATPGGEVYIALREKPEDGWHTFWRNAGDAGEPTRVIWTLPAGWKAGDIVWPTPKPFPVGPLMNYVYSTQTLLPMALTAPANARPGETVHLKAEVVYQVCSDSCVPGQETLTLDVPIAAGAPLADAKWGAAIAKALADAPKPAGLTAVFAANPAGKVQLAISGDPLKGADFSHAYFFPFDTNRVDHAAPQPAQYGPDGVTFTLAAGPAFKATPAPATLNGVLSLGGAAYEVEGVPATGALPATAASLGPVKANTSSTGGGLDLPLWQAMAFALLGGLILNLMPCVFPVLSMKAASLAVHAHDADGGKAARVQGIAFLVGVMVTFLALAGGLMAAKAAGSAVGWGFQLQSPPVVAGLVLLMLLVALNLAGLFEIGLSAQGVGQDLATKGGVTGAFFTGALAVVVAAPCTAPFMGPALGYALLQPAVVALPVFAALGLGFAAPFTAVAFAPGLLRRLPRPGAWMSVFKTVLSFPMFGAAAWLAWVFAIQAGVNAMPFLFAAAILTAFGAWLFGQGQTSTRPGRKLILQAALPLALVGSALLLLPVAKADTAENSSAAPGAQPTTAVPHEPWSKARLAALRAEGRPVFVDFTAAWCVSCKVNEGAALSNQGFADTLTKTNTAYLVADWTNHNAEIAGALAEFGRVGVPLYLVYPAKGGEPAILPQLLTPGLVRGAIEKAAKT